jgi:hypothetical protein
VSAALYNGSADGMMNLESIIRRHPFTALGIGFLTGFVFGGGHESRVGQGLIGFASKMAARQLAIAVMAQALNNERHRAS